ncbi:MAG: hypothetical protein V5B32_15830 [Candidatus Accumulibacter sp. UW26]|uniref:Uncharacterized protein n=2 Tax=Candidatus Accumulibacter TaxID=327159 RepID=A0A080LTY6_9PROT|nr:MULTISPECIES: hypothetical protein [Candidatus Accumulibacter]KFB71050.1 MAG: hypothetical protein AW09_003831 [Candidatus Accumulibacter phosphatis]NMQ07648.1 hypothetical protein [Candidatus Accumulibacter contiguus]HCZ16966.1 hypothetical protein [Accumulibacter sp.]HRF10615.1 hypothetical protein [Candidatus Accumulibacter phosphatis]
MPAADHVIDIDGLVYATDFQGFDKAMNARSAAGAEVDLRPWPLREHLAALDECVVPTAHGLTLDTRELSRRVLAHSGVAEDAQTRFAPLALWWASGGETSPAALGGGWYDCGGVRLHLRPWTSGERFRAMSRCRRAGADGERFDLGAYLRAMLETSVVTVEPARALDELDSGATRSLLEAVVALNVVSPEELADGIPDTPEADRITLRLCRALGWTPTQVWATPAVEMDRLLRLLDRTAASESAAPTRVARLADHPDATVIRIEDD